MNDTWILEYANQTYGPYTTAQIVQMFQNNQLSGQTLLKSYLTGGYYKVQDIIQAATAQQMIQPGIQPQIVQPGMPSQMVHPSAFSVNGFPPQQPGFPPQMAQPGFPPQMVQPGVVPQTVQPGFAPQMAQPGAMPQMVQPGMAPQMVQPQMVQPGAVPQMVQPGVAPQMVQPQMVQPGIPPQQSDNPSQQQGINSASTQSEEQKTDSKDSPPNVTPLGFDGAEKNTTPPLREWIDRSNVENGTIVCPHCWGLCSLKTILFISEHPELIGDTLLGADAQKRFLPKYFTAKGTAFDERGMECTDMACPHCHLKIPNAVIDLPSSFFSIVGAPASGKSYFLTAMIWQLRKVLPKYFHYTLFDTDPSFNMVLNNYERILFLNPDQNEYVSLPKTELQGRDFSNQIIIENNRIDLPRPFVFTLSPQTSHPYYDVKKDELERSIVLYDNAGEHFEIGRDSITNLATVHLVHSDGIIFLYDPFKDIRMRQNCSKSDPQILKSTSIASNQIAIFTEMVARIHKYANLKANEKYNKPLIIVVPKYDAWKDAFPIDLSKLDLVVFDENVTPYLNMDAVCAVSFSLRKYLLEIAPEIVGLAEGASDQVYFVPVSAMGRIPEYVEKKEIIGIRPDHLAPIWTEVPFLLLLHMNNLLQAVYLSDDTIPYLEQFQFIHDHISFVFPDTNERYTLPSFYCGKTVYCSETNKYYRLPDYPEETDKQDSSQEDVEPTASEKEDEVEIPDQDFWTN